MLVKFLHIGTDVFELDILWDTILCIVECLAATLACVHYMLLALRVVTSKKSPDIARYLLGCRVLG